MDVTVRGGGVFGLAVAFACARSGARVRLIERRGIGAGASGGPVGALAPHVPEAWNPKKAFQFDSLIMAPAFWAAVEECSGLSPGYARTGRLQPVDLAALALAQARGEGAGHLWRGLAEWRVIRSPQDGWAESPGGWMVQDTLSARLHPARACAALAQALRELGGEVVIGEAPDQGAVLWATGAEGLADLSAQFGREIGGGVKGQALTLAFDAGDRPQLFTDGLHIVPHDDGTVAVGSTSERSFAAPDTTDAALEGLLARARAACPLLAYAPVLARWAGVRPRARSRAPMLGEWPGRPGHFIANGGFKIGFGMAPRVAEVMADLMLGGIDTIPDGFRVTDNL